MKKYIGIKGEIMNNKINFLTKITVITAFTLMVVVNPVIAAQAKPIPADRMLDPANHTLILIDHQPQMAFATASIDIVELRNNVAGLAKSAKVFRFPLS